MTSPRVHQAGRRASRHLVRVLDRRGERPVDPPTLPVRWPIRAGFAVPATFASDGSGSVERSRT